MIIHIYAKVSLYENVTANQCANILLEHITGCTVSNIFNSEESDGIVPISSGKWNAYLTDNFTKELLGVKHTGMGTNQNIINNINALLESTLQTFYTK